MSVSTFADYVDLATRERELSDFRRKLHSAIDSGNATELMLLREREVSARRRVLHRQIDVLRAELWLAPQPTAPTHAKRRHWFH